MSNRITDSSVFELKKKIESLPEVTIRPMFGYQCYSVKGKFFAGFGRKEDKSNVMIIRLSKELQLKALLEEEHLKIEPFRRAAKVGWIELEIRDIRIHEAFHWVKKGYEHALNI
jgi:YjbR